MAVFCICIIIVQNNLACIDVIMYDILIFPLSFTVFIVSNKPCPTDDLPNNLLFVTCVTISVIFSKKLWLKNLKPNTEFPHVMLELDVHGYAASW